MADIGEVVAAVQAAIDVCEQRSRELIEAADKTRRSQSRLAAVTEGSAHPASRDAKRFLDHSHQELTEAARNAVQAARHLRAYLSGLEGGGSSRSPSPASVPPQRSDAPSTAERLADFRPDRQHPRAIARTRDDGWPKNAAGNISARARLYDVNGYQLSETAYVADDRNEPSQWADLKGRWNDSEFTTTWHAEGRIAKDVRDSGLTQAAVYLNVPVCGAPRPGQERPDPQGCVENFRHIIPKDTVVYVFMVPENGSPRRRRIVGTGEGIK